MVSYKRLDYAVRTFARSGRRLKIAGDGPEYRNLKKISGPSIEFCGRVSDTGLRDLYARSNGLIMSGEEDFGITMVESLASGKPVIALGRGGAVEILGDDGGVLYGETSEAALTQALHIFDRIEPSFSPLHLSTKAAQFSEAVFEKNFRAVLSRTPESFAWQPEVMVRAK